MSKHRSNDHDLRISRIIPGVSSYNREPCYLTGLPDELILAIFNQLEVQRGYLIDANAETERQRSNRLVMKALHSSVLTCKHLSRIATPQLYSSLIQTSWLKDCSGLMLRTLSQRPDLAHHLHYLELNKRMKSGDETPNMSKDDLAAIQKFMSNHPTVHRYRKALCLPNRGLPYSTYTLSRLEYCATMTTSVLILLASNLQALASEFTFFERGPLAHRVASQTSHLHTWWIKNIFYHGSYLTISAGPDASNSVGNFAYFYESNDGYRSPYLRASELPVITAIDFSFFLADHSDLEQIFDCCTGLKRFSCKWTERGRVDEYDNWIGIDLPEIHRLLSRFEDSLESLKLDSMDAGCLVDMAVDVEALGALRNFVALKHLDVSGLVLWGDYASDDHVDSNLSDLLPEFLEFLKIDVEWDDDVEEAFYLFLTECKAMQPRLKKIECSWSAAPKAIAIDLVESFRQLGIELVLQVDALDIGHTNITST